LNAGKREMQRGFSFPTGGRHSRIDVVIEGRCAISCPNLKSARQILAQHGYQEELAFGLYAATQG
jgi:hypothetical protein